MEMPFTKQVIARIRPERAGTVHTPWATLMFARLPAFPKEHDPAKRGAVP